VGSDCIFSACGIGGICGLTHGNGCLDKDECQSGFCVDGVCCDTACTGTCKACNLPNHVGICTSVPLGQADDTCKAPSAACDGAGQCRSGLGQPCMADSQCASTFMHCVDGVCCNTACDGVCQSCIVTGSFGTCSNVPAGAQDPPTCEIFQMACNGAGACRFGCSSMADCTARGLSTCMNGFCY
jgi:hypothetical protein